MAKVSIGLRGWRFEESEIFDDDGEFKPLDEIPEDPRRRLMRLRILLDKPCHACYLIHGSENVERCNPVDIVYGEPGDEILLCDQHEAEFLYWYREAGGKQYRGEEAFRDEFHEWFAAGNRAPEGYGGLRHVETASDELPEPPGPEEVQRRLNENFDGEKIDIWEMTAEEGEERPRMASPGPATIDEDDSPDEDPLDEDPLDEDDLDDVLGTDYPSK